MPQVPATSCWKRLEVPDQLEQLKTHITDAVSSYSCCVSVGYVVWHTGNTLLAYPPAQELARQMQLIDTVTSASLFNLISALTATPLQLRQPKLPHVRSECRKHYAHVNTNHDK